MEHRLTTNKDKADFYSRNFVHVFKPNDIASDLRSVQFQPLKVSRKRIKYLIAIEVAQEIDGNIYSKKAPG